MIIILYYVTGLFQFQLSVIAGKEHLVPQFNSKYNKTISKSRNYIHIILYTLAIRILDFNNGTRQATAFTQDHTSM